MLLATRRIDWNLFLDGTNQAHESEKGTRSSHTGGLYTIAIDPTYTHTTTTRLSLWLENVKLRYGFFTL
jgi:hypothetical protein